MRVAFADAEVVKYCARHQRDRGTRQVISDAFVFQESPDPRCRFESECAASGKRDAMNALREMQRTEEIEFLCAACRTAYISATNGPVFAQDGGAAGDAVVIGNVAHQNARNVGKAFHLAVRTFMLASGSGEFVCSIFLRGPWQRCRISAS